MTEAMFTDADLYDDDPIRPGLNAATPISVVASLNSREEGAGLAFERLMATESAQKLLKTSEVLK